MSDAIADGTERSIEGRLRVFYDGYWIKAYPVPSNTLLEKRHLIEMLTRRLFNHVEHGLFVPGHRLEEARDAFESERDPARKRVKGGMLAGALFNRATDILKKLVELQAMGVEIPPADPLMQRCGEHLQEALELGKAVLHRSGEEGIDELWGEPIKAFAFPVQDFYRSRYLKVAATMRCIDQLAAEMTPTFEALPPFAGIGPLLDDLASAAKVYSETMRSDTDVFDVGAAFAVGCEKLLAFANAVGLSRPDDHEIEHGVRLIRDGTDLISYIARARVPMPKSTKDYVARCSRYSEEAARLGRDVAESTVARRSTRPKRVTTSARG